MIEPPTEARLSLAANEGFQPAFPLSGNRLPEYPGVLLARQLPPQTICATVDVDGEGRVAVVLPERSAPECAGPGEAPDPLFLAETERALKTWRFEPAFRCVYPDDVKADLNCLRGGAEEIPQPIRLAYRFRFEQIDGRGQVGFAR